MSSASATTMQPTSAPSMSAMLSSQGRGAPQCSPLPTKFAMSGSSQVRMSTTPGMALALVVSSLTIFALA